ncbi:hypothetical protein ECANGB1_1036 [Enterospora canceri]|uniref:Uncharacterized protein n=1 Tax=Enterospora canceri TaxID=1081671 RepID=A0A1Y1S6Y5_9MICR|nr:hypothetical protein ECANGB1_1036 [Enterospora canceri]
MNINLRMAAMTPTNSRMIRDHIIKSRTDPIVVSPDRSLTDSLHLLKILNIKDAFVCLIYKHIKHNKNKGIYSISTHFV